MTALTFWVLDIFAEPYAAAPQLTARLRIEESTGTTDPRDRAALPGADRAAAPGLQRVGGSGLLALFGERPVAGHAAAVPVDAVHRDGPGLHRPHRGRSAAAVHVRLRGDGLEVPARAAGRDRPAGVAVLRNHLHQGHKRLRGRAGALGLRGVLCAAGQRSGSR